MERGYFSQQGLDVQTTIVTNSNDTLPLVATGKMDVANNAVTAFMVNAVNEGVNMKWVAGQAVYTPEARHPGPGRPQGAVRQRRGPQPEGPEGQEDRRADHRRRRRDRPGQRPASRSA